MSKFSTKTEILIPYNTFISYPFKYGPTGHNKPWSGKHGRMGNPRMYVFDDQKKEWIIYDKAGHTAGTTGVLINGWTYDEANEVYVRKTTNIENPPLTKSKSLLDYIPYVGAAALAVPLLALGYRRATRPNVARARRRRSRRSRRRRRSSRKR
tara:strand:+ start:1584 stop:2042 length:459 start_codon:yes stop_codon:yes gene_type:complete